MEYNYRVLASLPNAAYCLNAALNGFTNLTNRSDSVTIMDALIPTHAILANNSKSYLIGNTNRFTYTTNVFKRGQERNPFSLECWFLPSYNTAANMSILSHTGAFDGLWFDGNKIHFTIEFATLPALDITYETNDFPDAMHIVGAYTNGKIQLYVDGQMRAEADVTADQIKDGFKSRANYNLYSGVTDGSTVTGSQDAVATYAKALTDAEVYLHFMSGRNVSPASNIVGRYGGNLFDGTQRSVAGERIWEGNWAEDAISADVDFADGVLKPMNDFVTGLSVAGTWRGVFQAAPVDPQTPLYDVRLGWDADGQYTVEASIDNGTTWAVVTNGQNIAGTYNWTPASDTNILIRVTFAGGTANDISEFRRIRVTAYNSQFITGTDISRQMELTSIGIATNPESNEPIESNTNAGFNVTNGTWNINPDDGVDPKPVRTLEFWIKAPNMTGVTGRYIFDTRPDGGTEYLWTSGTNAFAYVSGQLYINGVAYASGAVQMRPGIWYHIVYVLSADISTRIVSNAAGPKNYGLIATYPTALTATDAANMYSMYTGSKNSRMATDSNPITEQATPYKLYAYDWSISPTG